MLAIVVCSVVFAVAVLVFVRVRRRSDADPFAQFRRVLLVIAHPDDECMFFGPTIMHFRRTGIERLFILSITSGYRAPELIAATKVFGLSPKQVRYVNRSDLPDDINTAWNTPILTELIDTFIESLRIDAVITFDNGGVSGHLNHISLRHAVANCSKVSLVRKYMQIFDLMLCSTFDRNLICLRSGFADYALTIRAMTQHRSQLTWYRCLYLMFSRYLIVNSLRKI